MKQEQLKKGQELLDSIIENQQVLDSLNQTKTDVISTPEDKAVEMNWGNGLNQSRVYVKMKDVRAQLANEVAGSILETKETITKLKKEFEAL